MMAVENKIVRGDMVETTEFPQLAIKYNVTSVPKVVVNDKVEFLGALSEGQFIDHVLLAL